MQHRKLTRQFRAKDAFVRDQNLLCNPSATFSRIRAVKRGRLGKINKLKVNDKEQILCYFLYFIKSSVYEEEIPIKKYSFWQEFY